MIRIYLADILVIHCFVTNDSKTKAIFAFAYESAIWAGLTGIPRLCSTGLIWMHGRCGAGISLSPHRPSTGSFWILYMAAQGSRSGVLRAHSRSHEAFCGSQKSPALPPGSLLVA